MKVLTYNQAADICGITRRTLERLIKSGDGPSVIDLTFGKKGRRGILDCDLDEWLLKRRRPKKEG